MTTNDITITYIGGPTVLLEFGGIRVLTDPTFDPGGGKYPSGPCRRAFPGQTLPSAEALGYYCGAPPGLILASRAPPNRRGMSSHAHAKARPLNGAMRRG